MIQGYDAGTEVKWNEDNTLTTGVIEEVLYQSGTIDVNGDPIWIEVGDHSPVYLVRHHTGSLITLEHTDVMLQHTNHHT